MREPQYILREVEETDDGFDAEKDLQAVAVARKHRTSQVIKQNLSELARLLKEEEKEEAGEDAESEGDGEAVLALGDEEEMGASEVQMQDAGEVGSTDGVVEGGEGIESQGVSQVGME